MYNKNVSLCVHSKSHFLDPFLSIRSNIWKMGPTLKESFFGSFFEHTLKDQWKMGPWVHAQTPIENMLKDPFFICLSVCSKTNFSYVWAYAQGPIFHIFEHKLKDPFFICLSKCSRTHFTNYPIFLVFTFSFQKVLSPTLIYKH